jgi:hypothetical protein
MDAGFVAGRLYEARHPLAIVNRVIRLAAVAGFAAYVVISSAARSNDIPVVFGIVGLGAVLLITWSWLSDLLGPSGRAMRLVWQARNLPASDRRALLMAAADLDPKSGGASVHGQA